MMDSVTAKAYAKINLSLDIKGVLPNGYHELDMIMQTVTLFDTVHVSKSGSISVKCGRGIPNGRNNICWRAAESFFKAAEINGGADIKIEKKIPSQAGLGGGSADAAAVLRALNEIYRTGFSTEKLCAIGAEVGADVPFCIKQGTCTARGIGEKLYKINCACDYIVLIAKPDCGVSTAGAFARYDDAGAYRRPDNEALKAALETGDSNAVGKLLCNVFEELIMPEQSQRIKQDIIKAGALGSCMTGSGSAVYGIFESCEKAYACFDNLPVRDKFICKIFTPNE